MANEATETLEVDNFLSISHIKWEFKQFNIITGDMGAGKSLCIKLLKFFEDIVSSLLILPYDNFLENLDANQFYKFLSKKFSTTFILSLTNSAVRQSFVISYAFSYEEESFDVTIKGTDVNDIRFESLYLEKLLPEWNKRLQKKNINNSEKITPDGFDEVKNSLYANVLKKFNGCFPMATTFIPASRAALAFGSDYTDNYLKDYKRLVDVLPRFVSRNEEIVNTILKAKIKINGSLLLESNDGRQVPISNASSGQQEIIYVLMLLDKLGNFRYTYGGRQSLFIEEPSAHLFPLEQKQTIELIVRIYHYLKDNGNPVRFFITTHSPYILNSLNNILTKGVLLEKYKCQEERINADVNIPHIFADEISAYFISGNGTGESMLDADKKYLYADKIADISRDIDIVTQKLAEINNELLDEEE
jgi:predicted ATPase